MFREYALDPELLSNWLDFRYFTEKFGWSKGRLISEYPKKWKRMVIDSLSDCKPLERKRIVERLKKLSDRLVRRKHAQYNPELAVEGSVWVANVLEQHQDLPFQGILTNNVDAGNETIILGDELEEEDPLFMPGSGMTLRTAEDFVENLKFFLQSASEISFVDPHFSANESRFTEPLKQMMTCACEQNYRPDVPRFALHVCAGNRATKDEETIERRKNNLTREANAFLPSIVPNQSKLTVFIWAEQPGGERFHNRYVFSERAGVSFGTGLDCEESESGAEAASPRAEDDLFRLSNAQHAKYRTKFSRDSTALELLQTLDIFPSMDR